jgi:hypothetical protein
MRLVHTSLGKKLGLQRVDGGPESADRLPFGALCRNPAGFSLEIGASVGRIGR